jgi:uncharacterized OB-fold protein
MFDTRKKCLNCGEDVKIANVCPHCGHEHQEDWKTSGEAVNAAQGIYAAVFLYVIEWNNFLATFPKAIGYGFVAAIGWMILMLVTKPSKKQHLTT